MSQTSAWASAPIEDRPIALRLLAEALGTFLLVFGGVGAWLFASHLADEQGAFAPGVVYLAASLATGMAFFAGHCAFAPVSGGHFNPAVTLGLAAAGRFAWADTWRYAIAQAVGGVVATTVLMLVGLFGPAGWLEAAQNGGFASNGWGSLSPAGFAMPAAIIVEAVLTGFLVSVFLGVTRPGRASALAGPAIGFLIVLIHLVSMPVDGGSANPARSIAAALYGGGPALVQLWVFIVFPVAGALIAGFAHRALFDEPRVG